MLDGLLNGVFGIFLSVSLFGWLKDLFGGSEVKFDGSGALINRMKEEKVVLVKWLDDLDEVKDRLDNTLGKLGGLYRQIKHRQPDMNFEDFKKQFGKLLERLKKKFKYEDRVSNQIYLMVYLKNINVI